MAKEEYIRVLVIRPYNEPEELLCKNELKAFQETVGGSIECTYPYPDEVGLICNEEGKITGLPLNRALKDSETMRIYDIIAGNFLVAGLSDDGNFRSLTNEEYNKFYEKFKRPERFTVDERGIRAEPYITVEDFIKTWVNSPTAFFNGPQYRGAQHPEFNPNKINESAFEDAWRAKAYSFSLAERKDGVKCLMVDWTSQEVGKDNGVTLFREICRAVEANAQEQLAPGETIAIELNLKDRFGLFSRTFSSEGTVILEDRDLDEPEQDERS
ncbi:MAG: DUF3846 domain-containing protein [Clostridiales bacterium]|nr:DUF3846 domain-containing protein [Clostridiales bacterium]